LWALFASSAAFALCSFLAIPLVVLRSFFKEQVWYSRSSSGLLPIGRRPFVLSKEARFPKRRYRLLWPLALFHGVSRLLHACAYYLLLRGCDVGSCVKLGVDLAFMGGFLPVLMHVLKKDMAYIFSPILLSTHDGAIYLPFQQYLIPPSELNFIKNIGSGRTGNVYLCSRHGKRIVVKRFNFRSLNKEDMLLFNLEAEVTPRTRNPEPGTRNPEP
jgi:hypothetical protein